MTTWKPKDAVMDRYRMVRAEDMRPIVGPRAVVERATLPVSRAAMVISRYGGVLLTALAGPAISCGSGVNPFGDLFFLSFAAFFTVNVSLIVPLYYNVGIAKARMVSLVLMMVPGMAGGALIGWDQMMPGPTQGAPWRGALADNPLPQGPDGISFYNFYTIDFGRLYPELRSLVGLDGPEGGERHFFYMKRTEYYASGLGDDPRGFGP